MGYKEMVEFVWLMTGLLIYKASELALHGIDNLRRPAHGAVIGYALRHPDGIGKEHHAEHALKLVTALRPKNRQAETPAARPEQRDASRGQHICQNMAPYPAKHRQG